MPASDPIAIRYTFHFGKGAPKSFEVRFDRENLDLLSKPDTPLPEWTKLEFHQCPNCPLDAKRHLHCPVAANLSPVIAAFSDALSFETVDATVDTENRSYSRKGIPLQRAISSLLGTITVTSGCPVLNHLRPMVDTHLPFATADETTYRVLSMYLLGQYFRAKHGLEPDWTMGGLLARLEAIQAVNIAFCDRLRAIEIEDASINALVILNTFGDMTTFSLAEDDMERLERIFLANCDIAKS